MQILNKFKNKKTLIRLASLGDQILFSAANFMLTIILARFYTPLELAAYGVAITIALMISGIQQNSYVIQNAVLLPEIFKRRIRKIFGQQLIVWGIIFAAEIIVLFLYYVLFDSSPFVDAIAFATITCTLLYTQIGFDRILMIKHERFIDPLASSFIFCAFISGLFFVIPKYHISFDVMMSFIAIFIAIKNIWMFLIIGKPDFFWGWRLVKRDVKRNLASSLVGMAGSSGFVNFPVFILALLSTQLQTAVFGAMRSLMQPVMVVLRSLDVVDKNYFQHKGNSFHGIQKSLLRLLLIYGGLCFISIILMGCFSTQIVHFIYGEKYVANSHLLIGWGFIMLFIGISGPIETVLIKLDRFRSYNYCRIPAGIIGLVLAFILSEPWGAWGTVIASISGWIFSVAAGIWLIRDVLFYKRNFDA